jgi:hypothetical protein
MSKASDVAALDAVETTKCVHIVRGELEPWSHGGIQSMPDRDYRGHPLVIDMQLCPFCTGLLAATLHKLRIGEL